MSFQVQGHQDREADALGEKMETGKEQTRGKQEGAPWRGPVGCQAAPLPTLYNECWPCSAWKDP